VVVQIREQDNTALNGVQVLIASLRYTLGAPIDMTFFEETIAAISTAPGIGAIAVVRLSGKDAQKIAKIIFRRKEKSEVQEFKANHATFGYVIDPRSGDTVDEVVLTAFIAPHSYTGEDLIEISCHGGPVVTAEILAILLNEGARLARPGEFTQRAFMAGRIDLTQAEAVLDVIQAKTSRQGRRALSALAGVLGERIRKVRNNIMELLTRVVAGIDFPEEIGDAPEPEIERVVNEALIELEDLAKTARTGRFLREGLKLAIVGRPNAGKSSLLNRLLQFERAIVTDIPGTTRDSLEEMLDLNGIPIVLVDTAGIRHTEDQVEQIGIAESDLALVVVDATQGIGEPEKQIIDLLGDKPRIMVKNKIDVARGKANGDEAVGISALTGENINELTQAIEQFVFEDKTAREGPSLNARQAELCLKAAASLRLVITTVEAGYPQDCLATDLKTAVDALSEISGQSVSEEVITQVFATFCIGK
jgi:tRNA modification GTPase